MSVENKAVIKLSEQELDVVAGGADVSEIARLYLPSVVFLQFPGLQGKEAKPAATQPAIIPSYDPGFSPKG
ncbi:hypothetical protein BV378_26580 [Nostoc sp. RF31YmG]|jgi:hypothetical protein|nr:hypothetical protein BV378_26580 [Nostoc sp. RF31YmG]